MINFNDLVVLTYSPEFEEFPKIYYYKLNQVYVMVENKHNL